MTSQCSEERPCVQCFTGGYNCLKTMNGHTLDCLYVYELNSLGLTDTPDMRVLFWSAHQALRWDKNDQYVNPDLNPTDCPCAGRVELVVKD